MSWLQFIPQVIIVELLGLALKSISRPAANALLLGIDNLEKAARETKNPYDNLLVQGLRSFIGFIGNTDK